MLHSLDELQLGLLLTPSCRDREDVEQLVYEADFVATRHFAELGKPFFIGSNADPYEKRALLQGIVN